MTFEIVGIKKETGKKVRLVTHGVSLKDAEKQAVDFGVVVERVVEIQEVQKWGGEQDSQTDYLQVRKKPIPTNALGIVVIILIFLLTVGISMRLGLTAGFFFVFLVSGTALAFQQRKMFMPQFVARTNWFWEKDKKTKGMALGVVGVLFFVGVGAVVYQGIRKKEALRMAQVERENNGPDAPYRVHFEVATAKEAKAAALGYAKAMFAQKLTGTLGFSETELTCKTGGMVDANIPSRMSKDSKQLTPQTLQSFGVRGIVYAPDASGEMKKHPWLVIVAAKMEQHEMVPYQVFLDNTIVFINRNPALGALLLTEMPNF